MAIPAIVGTAKGFPAAYGQHIQNSWSNNQGDKVVISPSAGSTLVAFVFGLKSFNPFDLIHGNSGDPGFFPGLNDFAAAPTVSDASVDVVNVTAVSITSNVLTVTAANNFIAAQTVKLSGFTGGASFLNGQTVTVATASSTQFTAALTHANYGTSSAATAYAIVSNVLTVTVANTFAIGSKVKLGGFTLGSYLNGQTVTVLTASGTQFTAAFTHADDSATEAGTAVDADTGSGSMTAGNTWLAAAGKVLLGGSDYTASLGDFTRSSKWSLDGKYPSVYIFYALNVTAGTYTISVNSCYQDGTTRPQDLAAGKPIFDGGVDIHVFEFSGVAAAAATDGSTGQMSAANPAVAPSYTTTTSGDLILTAGLMKSGNAFSTYAPVGTTGTTMLAAGKCVNSQAHWAVQMQLQTANGAIAPGFTNPLGYEMAVASVALKAA